MMNRYSTTITGSSYNGKRFYNTTIYPIIYPSQNDIYIISKETDRLDFLSLKYYKDKTLWWIIAQANNLGKGSLSIPTGIQITIPNPSNIDQILNNFTLINS